MLLQYALHLIEEIGDKSLGAGEVIRPSLVRLVAMPMIVRGRTLRKSCTTMGNTMCIVISNQSVPRRPVQSQGIGNAVWPFLRRFGPHDSKSGNKATFVMNFLTVQIEKIFKRYIIGFHARILSLCDSKRKKCRPGAQALNCSPQVKHAGMHRRASAGAHGPLCLCHLASNDRRNISYQALKLTLPLLRIL